MTSLRRIALFGLVISVFAGCQTGPIVKEGATPQKVSEGYKFTEGPAVDAEGNVYFSDIPNNRIHKLDAATEQVSVFREDSGGANGLMLDAEGNIVACEGGRRRIVKISTTDAAAPAIIAANYRGTLLNSPNDLTIARNGGIYFTDPRYGNRDSMEMQIEGVYHVAPDGLLTRVVDDLVRPNGIQLSLDGKTLYVADNAEQTILAYDVGADGMLSNKRLFAQMDPLRRGGPDGMTIDARGNIYAAGQGRIYIWSPRGKLLEAIDFPEGPANCIFGGKDRMTLYVTARTSVYKLEMNVKGGY